MQPNGDVTYTVSRNGTDVYSGPALSFVDDQLSSGTSYEYVVVASNSLASTTSPSQNAVTFAGGSPRGVVAPILSTLTESIVQVCWNSPIDTGVPVVYRFLIDEAVYRPAVQTQEDRLCGFIEQLEAYTDYSVRIEACFDEDNGACSVSASSTVKTQCGSPIAVKPTVAGNNVTVQVNWELPLPSRCDVTTFTLEYTDESIDANPFVQSIAVANQLSYVLRDLSHSTLYSVRITSENAVGRATGDWVSVLTGEGVPSVVGAPSVEALGATQGSSEFLVSWTPPTLANGKVVSYTLFQNATNVSYTLSTSTLVRNLLPATDYEFIVRACTTGTFCSDSPSLMYTTPSIAPSGVTPPSLIGNETAFNFTLSWDEPTTKNGELLDYVIEVKACWHPCNLLATIVKKVSASETTITISANPSSNYSARVIASTTGGSTSSTWLSEIQTEEDDSIVPIVSLQSSDDMAAGSQAALVIMLLLVLAVVLLVLLYKNVPAKPSMLKDDTIGNIPSNTFWLTEEESVVSHTCIRLFFGYVQSF
jgi:hypothetical protein